jgi:aconitate hydratase
MLGLTFVNVDDYEKVRQDDTIDILGFDTFTPGKNLGVRLNHADGTSEDFEVAHTYNQAQIDWVVAGSALNKIREEIGK